MSPATVASSPTTDEWLEKAAALAPLVSMYRDQSEHDRRMAPPLFECIRETGIFDMLVPRALGGPQTDCEAYLRVVEELARQDGSTGWNVMIWAAQGLFADYLPADTARHILGVGQGTLIAGAVNPTGRATPVPGGFEVTGRWSFASGCQYATWLIAGCTVMEGERPRLLSSGVPDLRLVLLPAGDCEIVDTWHAAGLRGTGSHDFRAAGIRVPAEHTIALPAVFQGPLAREDAAYRTPFYDLACPSIAAVGLGIARDAIESFTALAAGKTPAIGTHPLADLHTIQQRVGKAESLVRSARAYLYATLREVTADHQAGAAVSEADSAALRLAATHCAQSAVEAVDLLFDASGGTAVYESSRLERCFRDVHMVTHHMMASPLTFEMVGQYLLGGPLLVRR